MQHWPPWWEWCSRRWRRERRDTWRWFEPAEFFRFQLNQTSWCLTSQAENFIIISELVFSNCRLVHFLNVSICPIFLQYTFTRYKQVKATRFLPSTKWRCLCYKSNSMQNTHLIIWTIMKSSHLYMIMKSSHLYMMSGGLQDVTALLLSCSVSRRQEEGMRRSSSIWRGFPPVSYIINNFSTPLNTQTHKTNRLLWSFSLTLRPALPLLQPVALGPVRQGWTQLPGCSPYQQCATGP